MAQQDGAPELTPKASQAIEKGLKYLLSVQKPNGSWGDPEVGITSLALMAFMAQGHFPGFGPYGNELDRAKEFLLKKAQEGPIGYVGAVMYEHGLATLALCEMWGMTRDKKDDEAIQKALEAAVKVILRSQNKGGGWRYQPSVNAGQDTSVTIMIFVALASARQAGIVVPNETITKVMKYLEDAWNSEDGGFGYLPKSSGQGAHKTYSTQPCTGGGAYIAQLAGRRDSEMVAAALRYLEKQAPGIFANAAYYYYAHYYAIQAMVQAGDEQYAAWYPKIRDALITKQSANGAWGDRRGDAGPYQTPMAIIILATPHRYIPIYQR
jgi:squalene cyclase